MTSTRPTSPLTGPLAPEFLDVRRIRLTEVAPPPLPPEVVAARDRAWEAAVRGNPELFDGPVALCVGLAPDGPDGLVVSWARATFRHRMLRELPGAVGWAPSLFVSVVQPAGDGRVLVGRMAPWTVAPGRWQLPGGSVEPPGPSEALDAAGLAREAARELVEEVGVAVAPGEPTVLGVTRGGRGAVGVAHLAPPLPEAVLRERYGALVAAERAAGRVPELDRIALVRPGDRPGAGEAPRADYLEPLFRHLADTAR
ncbi:NUDIX hydrolase [Streptomyces sp. JNUCC 64]